MTWRWYGVIINKRRQIMLNKIPRPSTSAGSIIFEGSMSTVQCVYLGLKNNIRLMRPLVMMIMVIKKKNRF